MKNADMPAMPQNGETRWDSSDYGGRGLTKREHFAGMAMQGFISYGSTDKLHGAKLARLSVHYADALLKELEK